jgi:hypothetical protein
MRDRALALLVAVPFVVGMASGPASDKPQPLFRFADPAITESSGLVALPGGLVVTVNDSGDSARVFVVDSATGRTVGTTTWSGAPVDDEALAAAGPDQVWVGDIGDNTTSRDSIRVTLVPVGTGERSGSLASYVLRYPQHRSYDAEALLADPVGGRLFVVTKSVLGGRIFAAPARLAADRPNSLRQVGNAPPLVTDGSFVPAGDRVVLRDYGRFVELSFPGWRPLTQGALPPQRQGEGLAVDEDGRLLVSSEGARQPVYAVPDPLSPPPSPAVTTPTSSASPTPPLLSRTGQELPEEQPADRDPRGFLIGAGVAVVALLVLWRALRPR